MARVDISILREIAQVIENSAKVPDYVVVNKRRFHVAYLEDHRQRIEEALRRHDRNQLNMLFGQLESKVKYQLERPSSGRKSAAKTPSRSAAKKTATKASTDASSTVSTKVAKKPAPAAKRSPATKKK